MILAKQDFKFSAAHFLIFDEKHAERLHGHNYRVKVRLSFLQKKNALGYYVDFNKVKKIIRDSLSKLDEMIILPQKNKEFLVKEINQHTHINFRDRYYVFPSNEVCWLPLDNTSVENLSFYLADQWKYDFQKFGTNKIDVYVEESAGQGATISV